MFSYKIPCIFPKKSKQLLCPCWRIASKQHDTATTMCRPDVQIDVQGKFSSA